MPDSIGGVRIVGDIPECVREGAFCRTLRSQISAIQQLLRERIKFAEERYGADFWREFDNPPRCRVCQSLEVKLRIGDEAYCAAHCRVPFGEEAND